MKKLHIFVWLSRRFNIDTEWSLSQTSFDKILSCFETPQIDLFASRLNRKCFKYVSWKRDPSAFDIDALTLDWSAYLFYAFPPFSLILKCLHKIVNERATGIMVVPYWPSQPWYPFLHHSCTTRSCIILITFQDSAPYLAATYPGVIAVIEQAYSKQALSESAIK